MGFRGAEPGPTQQKASHVHPAAGGRQDRCVRCEPAQQAGAGEGRAGALLTGRPALGQQQAAHLPEEPAQRLGRREEGCAVAGVGWQPVRSEALRSGVPGVRAGQPAPRPRRPPPPPDARRAPLGNSTHLCEEVVLEQVVQTGPLGGVGRQQAGDEAAGIG